MARVMLDLPTLPQVWRSEQATQVRDYLQSLDRRLDGPLALTLYGAVAVALYLADDPSILAVTRDIDVTGPPGTLKTLDDVRARVNRALDGAQVADLWLDFTSVQRFFVGPDWEQNLVDVSAHLSLSQLRIALLHPVDLIFSKLLRGKDKDYQDCVRLNERFVGERGRASFDAYFYQAYPFAHSERDAARLREAYEELTEREFDEARVDRFLTNL